MSYKDGLAAMSGEIVGGSIFRFPSEVKAHFAQTDADMTAFRRDVLLWAQGKNGADLEAAKGFDAFYKRWKATDHEDVDDSENWRRRLIGWRQTFIHRGMQPTTPHPELIPKKDPYIIPVLIGAGGAFLGAYLIEKFVRDKRPQR